MNEAQPLRVSDFDYKLPPDLIAQSPPAERDAARLLVLDRATGDLRHSAVRDLDRWLDPGDLLVANDTRVLPARLRARKADTGGAIELLLLRPDGAGRWWALAKPARRVRAGSRLLIAPNVGSAAPALAVRVEEVGADGQVLLAVTDEHGPQGGWDAYGTVPLPPYIRVNLEDPERYQTVFAAVPGSAAAPTAGLHFTPDLIGRLKDAGIGWAEVTLHVGLDTFRPMTADLVAEHRIHREWCSISDETARRVAATRVDGRRVVAVGTTVARALETLGQSWDPAAPSGFAGTTALFIRPGHRWTVVDALLTNFHLPRSTLLLLVGALAGTAAIRRAYAAAISERYRFYSFGDAMLIR